MQLSEDTIEESVVRKVLVDRLDLSQGDGRCRERCKDSHLCMKHCRKQSQKQYVSTLGLQNLHALSKRQLMMTLGASILSMAALKTSEAEAEEEMQPPEVIRERNAEKVRKEVGSADLLVDYTKAGPYDIRTLPTILEHTCANCYPQCVDGERSRFFSL